MGKRLYRGLFVMAPIEALRALYLIGQLEDLPAILPYERDLPDISTDVRQQAIETENAIRSREAH